MGIQLNFLKGATACPQGKERQENLNSQTERHETNERSAGLRPAAAPNEIAASSVSERASQCEAAAGRESRAPFVGRRMRAEFRKNSASSRRRLQALAVLRQPLEI